MGTERTIAGGEKWHLYEDWLDGRTWLEIEDIRELDELEVTSPVGTQGKVTIELVPPPDLVEAIKKDT